MHYYSFIVCPSVEMGNKASLLVQNEKNTWINPHILEYYKDQRRTQQDLLKNFKTSLQLMKDTRYMYGVEYEHYWITDGTWTMEFGGGHTLDDNRMLVHENSALGAVVATFAMDEDVKKRMMQLCGASNYSLALRNCEHAARYIHSGAWMSFQLVDSAQLKTIFMDYLGDYTKDINTSPYNLLSGEIEEVCQHHFRDRSLIP